MASTPFSTSSKRSRTPGLFRSASMSEVRYSSRMRLMYSSKKAAVSLIFSGTAGSDTPAFTEASAASRDFRSPRKFSSPSATKSLRCAAGTALP